MPRVLLLLPTTTYRTQAFMEAARRLGVEVTVASEEASTLANLNPSGLLRLNFSEPQRAARQVVQFAGMHPIAAVVPVDDQVTICAATICQALGLRHNSVEAVHAARNKYRMRVLVGHAGVPQPRYKLCSLDDNPLSMADQVDYPCVVKPLTLSGSRGVIRANTELEFGQAVVRLDHILRSEFSESHSSTGARSRPRHSLPATARQFIVEDFVPGQEVALDGLLTRGELRLLALFDKPDPLDGPFFEETIYVTPSRLPVSVQEDIAGCTARACRAIGLTEGPAHAELRINGDGPWMIEINSRSIGGLCSRVLRFGSALSLEELIIRHALDGDYVPPNREDQPAGVMMIPIPRAGVLTEVRGLDQAKTVDGIEQVTISARLGQELLPLPEGAKYLGFIFARAGTPEAVERALRASQARIEFRISPQEKKVVSRRRVATALIDSQPQLRGELIMPKTVKVAQTGDLAPGTGKVVQADGRNIALFNVEGTFFAIDNTCTHRGGPLGEGELSGDTVECPWHCAHFDVKTGAVTTPPAPTGVRSFPVKVEGNDVLVEVD